MAFHPQTFNKLHGQIILNNQQAHILKKTFFVAYNPFGNVFLVAKKLTIAFISKSILFCDLF
jgi:hypothetical protein